MQDLINIMMVVCAGHVACVGKNVHVYTHDFGGENWKKGTDQLRDWGVVKKSAEGQAAVEWGSTVR